MKHRIKTRCFSCICFCGYPRKTHSKLSISTRRGGKFLPGVVSKTLSRTRARAVSGTVSEVSSSDEMFSCHDVKKIEPSYQIAGDKEEKQYPVRELDGEASEISHESNSVNISRIVDSETSAVAVIPGSSYSEISCDKSYTDGILTNRDSEISYRSYRDERPKHREPKTRDKSYRSEIPIGTRGCETRCPVCCRNVIHTVRVSEISHKSHTDERLRGEESRSGHNISKIAAADDKAAKLNIISEHDGEASEISLHEGDSFEIPRGIDSETSGHKSRSDEISTSVDYLTSSHESYRDQISTSRYSEISHKSYRDERPRRREYKTNHKSNKIVFADDKVVKQYSLSEHDGDASEISHHESYIVEIPRSTESETSSEKSCMDRTSTRSESEISYKSYRHSKPRHTHSISSHKICSCPPKKHSKHSISTRRGIKFIPHVISKALFGTRAVSRTGSEMPSSDESSSCHDANKHELSYQIAAAGSRDSEIRSEKSFRDGMPIIRESEISDKSYRDDKPSHTVSKTSHKMSEIVDTDYKEVKCYTVSEHGGEISEIIRHEKYNLEIPRTRDSEISSQNSREGILTSKDFEISHKSYRDEKPTHRKYNTNDNISKIVVADDKVKKQYTLSDHDGEASEVSLHESYSVDITGNRDSETNSRNGCRDGIFTIRDSEINHESYKDEKPRHNESKTRDEISKIVSPDYKYVKQYTTSEYDGEASEIRLHENYAVEITRSGDSETSGQKNCKDGIPTSKDSDISHKSYSDEKPKHKESKTRHKVSKFFAVDDNEIKQYTMTQHEASEINLHESSSLDVPRSRDCETSSQNNCGYGVPTSRVSEINYKSYRDEKPKQTESKTSHKISNIVFVDNKEIKQCIMSEQDGEASETSLLESYSIEIPRSGDSEISSQNICRDGIHTNRDSEITHKSFRDDKPRHTESKTSHKIYKTVVADDKVIEQYTISEPDEVASDISLHESFSVQIPRSRDSETSSQSSYGDRIAANRVFEISHKSYRDEKPRYRRFKTSHNISKIVVADDEEIKQSITSENDEQASEIGLHESYSVEISASIDSETSGQKIYRDGIPTSRDSDISHKSYRDEKPRHVESTTSNKTSEIVVADDKEVKQYAITEHDGDASEISLPESYIVGIPRSTDSDTSSWKSCRDETDTSTDSEIGHNSYRYEKLRCRESKTRHKINKNVDGDDKVVKQYIMNGHDGEASEISLHESYSFEIPRSRGSETSSQSSFRCGIPTSTDFEICHKSFRDEEFRLKESKTSHRTRKIICADENEFKQYTLSEHDGEASEISIHESFSVETTLSSSRDSDISSQECVRDGIPTSRGSENGHTSYRDEKPKNRESKTSVKSYKIETPVPIKYGETSRQKSSCRGAKSIDRSSENWRKIRDRDELSMGKFAEIIRRKCIYETPQKSSEINQASYTDKKCFEVRQQCRDETRSSNDDSPWTSNEFEDHRDKSMSVGQFSESEHYDETIRQLVRQFFAEGGLHVAKVLEIDGGESISQISHPANLHKVVKNDEGTNCPYCTDIEGQGRGYEQEWEAHGCHEQESEADRF